MRELNTKYFSEFPVLKTKRLTLREIVKEDAERIFEMRKNSRVNEFVLRPNMEFANSAREMILKVKEAYKERRVLAWAGLLREQNEIIGTCGFNDINHQNRRAEIGGELLVNYWGKNIALEAVKAIVNFGFEKLGLNTIEAKVNPGNRGSIFLLESLGFEKEAHFKKYGFYQGKFHDLAVYTKFRPV